MCDPIDEKGIRILRDEGLIVDVKPRITPEELLREVERYQGLIVRGRTKVTKEVIDRGRTLRVIVRAGAGLDNIDVEYASERDIKVINTPEALSNAVAELTIGLMIALGRGICRGHEALKRGEWVKGKLIGRELKGKTIGIVGMGKIGRHVADKALGLGMKVSAYDVIPLSQEYKDKGVREVEHIDEVFADSDYITLHVPLMEETHHMVDEKLLRKMKSSAFLINASRGAVIDTEALIRALRGGWIAGAALDVFEVEPPIGSELLKFENVVATPHIGGQSVEAQREASITAAKKLIQAL
ncbi:MAG: hydroxyacid dehydrogenase [Candidatus Geothermarchaeales archaeon]